MNSIKIIGLSGLIVLLATTSACKGKGLQSDKDENGFDYKHELLIPKDAVLMEEFFYQKNDGRIDTLSYFLIDFKKREVYGYVAPNLPLGLAISGEIDSAADGNGAQLLVQYINLAKHNFKFKKKFEEKRMYPPRNVSIVYEGRKESNSVKKITYGNFDEYIGAPPQSSTSYPFLCRDGSWYAVTTASDIADNHKFLPQIFENIYSGKVYCRYVVADDYRTTVFESSFD